MRDGPPMSRTRDSHATTRQAASGEVITEGLVSRLHLEILPSLACLGVTARSLPRVHLVPRHAALPSGLIRLAVSPRSLTHRRRRATFLPPVGSFSWARRARTQTSCITASWQTCSRPRCAQCGSACAGSRDERGGAARSPCGCTSHERSLSSPHGVSSARRTHTRMSRGMSSASTGTRSASGSTGCSSPPARKAAKLGRTSGCVCAAARTALGSALSPRPSHLPCDHARRRAPSPCDGPLLTSLLSPVHCGPPQQLSLSAEPTDLELEVAKLRAIFEASRNAKLERWEIEKGIQSEGISLEALQIPAAQMNDFVIGELEGEPGWTLEAFLGWFLMQKDAELAAAVEAEAAAQAEGERAEREAAEAVRRAAEEEERQQARKSQEAALLARLSLYDADSDAEDAEAMERNRVAEVSQWEAKDVRLHVARLPATPRLSYLCRCTTACVW